jgi:hypothetical protein
MYFNFKMENFNTLNLVKFNQNYFRKFHSIEFIFLEISNVEKLH